MKKCRRIAILLLLCLFCILSLQTQAEQDDVEERLSKAESLRLTEWVDDEGYLTDSFFEGKTDSELSEMGIDDLIRTVTEEELMAYVEHLKAGISPLAVTYYEKVSQVNPDTGRTLYTGLFHVDGILAYCIERSVATPAQGSVTGEWQEVTNENVRKVLYYGYSGPADCGYTYVETALAAGEANGDGDNSLGRRILAEIQGKDSPPSTFKTWKVETNGGATQDLAFYTVEAKEEEKEEEEEEEIVGEGILKKLSNFPPATTGNSFYTLNNAVYGIYKNKACTTLVQSIRTMPNGGTKRFSLSPGKYYIKELKPPGGFLLSTTVHTITIKESRATSISVYDDPIMITPDILIQKVDAETNQSIAQGKGSLQGAQFQVRYYANDYEDGVDPQTLGAEPLRQWIFQTDDAGCVKLQADYMVSGDKLISNELDIPSLPFGTVTIQEIAASEGYRLNPQVYVVNLDYKTEKFETVRVPQSIIQLELTKYMEGTDMVLEGAVFEHLSPDGTVEQAASDANGKIIWKGLQVGEHKVKEVKAPAGYRNNLNEIIFTVDEAGVIDVTSEVHKGYGDVRVCFDAIGNLIVEVEDKIGYRFPETGHIGATLAVISGVVCCLLAMRKNKNSNSLSVFRRLERP